MTTGRQDDEAAVVLFSDPDDVYFVGARQDALLFLRSQSNPRRFDLRRATRIEHGFTELGRMLTY